MYCTSQLRPTAKPFLPALKLECCIAVRSLVSWEGNIIVLSPPANSALQNLYLEGEALVPVDPVSRHVGLSDLRQYFPAAEGEIEIEIFL